MMISMKINLRFWQFKTLIKRKYQICAQPNKVFLLTRSAYK